MDDFDYRTATEEQILYRAQGLQSMRLGDIPGVRITATEPKRGKGEVGAAIERYFGIPPNSRAEADFPTAGIELKAVPLLPTGTGYRVKERTVLGMIDYRSIIAEAWDTASVRKKLRILFVYYVHDVTTPKSEWEVIHTVLWEPDSRLEAFLKDDWEFVKEKVESGLAHLLSEADGRLMGPCTKGALASKVVMQPVTIYQEKARSRAFALKPAFTLAVFNESSARDRGMESILQQLHIKDVSRFEERVITRFRRYAGRSIEDVAKELDVVGGRSKSFAAGVIRVALGASSTRARVKEFEEMGLTPRVVRMPDGGIPYEATSFRAFRYQELVQETWEDSSLLADIEHMLFVPIYGAERSTPQAECVIGTPVFWKPSPVDMDIIEREWSSYVSLILKGDIDHLPGSSATEIIHVRPHARDSLDTDKLPNGRVFRKQSFWLNSRFVGGIINSG